MTTYLVLNYAGPRPQADSDWQALFARLEAAKALRGGSALGARSGYDGSTDVEAIASRIGGYLLISAPSPASVKELLRDSPIITSGGRIDIIEVVED